MFLDLILSTSGTVRGNPLPGPSAASRLFRGDLNAAGLSLFTLGFFFYLTAEKSRSREKTAVVTPP